MMLTVGQQLWYVPARITQWAQPKYVTVERVGRKWAEVSDINDRLSIETLYVDGGRYSSPGRCYLSQDEHDQEIARGAAWKNLRERVGISYRCPDGVDAADIQRALSILFPDA